MPFISKCKPFIKQLLHLIGTSDQLTLNILTSALNCLRLLMIDNQSISHLSSLIPDMDSLLMSISNRVFKQAKRYTNEEIMLAVQMLFIMF